MPRPEKVQAVADIKERIEGAQAVFLAEYAGLSVKDQQLLRRELRANGAEFKVVKMTLARRATDELEIDSLDDLLLGPTGLAFADEDPVGAARVLKDFAKGHETFVIKGGLLGIEFLSPERIAELAEIEPREVLLARLAGVMQAPMAKFAGLLAALPRNTAYALAELLEKKEAEEGPPAAGDSVAQEEPSADSQEPSTGEDSAMSDDAEGSEPEATDEVVEVDGDEPKAESAEESDEADNAPEADEDPKTEDEPEATAEASDDAGDDTEDQADEASKDDAEEE